MAVRTSESNLGDIGVGSPSLADTSRDIFTFVARGSCSHNPVYPPALHPGVQEQTHRGHETLYSEDPECNYVRVPNNSAALVFVVIWLQQTEESILFIHPGIAHSSAIHCLICLFCLFVSALFSPVKTVLLTIPAKWLHGLLCDLC